MIYYKDLKIKYIYEKSLKNTYIRIDKDSNIVLKTPISSKRKIGSIIEQKEDWIRKKLAYNLENPPLHLNLDGIDSLQSKEYLKEKVEYFSSKMGLFCSEVKFRKMKSRWGSCNSKGVITLNKKLIKTPEICIDYVVVHELAHLKYFNHSKRFHALVDRYSPDAKKAKEILSRVVFLQE